MNYEEERAAKRAADLTEPILQPQEWRKDHKYRPLLLEPVIDRDKLDRKAKLVKKIRQMNISDLANSTCLGYGCPSCPCDEEEDEDLSPSAAPKPATHAGYLNELVYRVQKHPEDKDLLATLLYEVHDDAALKIYPGKFAEGYTVNESWTAEDTAKVIESAKELAALPESNIPWPDESDHTIGAAALRAQTRRLAALPEEMIEQLAWQHERQEPEPDWWVTLKKGAEAPDEPAQEPDNRLSDTSDEAIAEGIEPSENLYRYDHGWEHEDPTLWEREGPTPEAAALVLDDDAAEYIPWADEFVVHHALRGNEIWYQEGGQWMHCPIPTTPYVNHDAADLASHHEYRNRVARPVDEAYWLQLKADHEAQEPAAQEPATKPEEK